MDGDMLLKDIIDNVFGSLPPAAVMRGEADTDLANSPSSKYASVCGTDRYCKRSEEVCDMLFHYYGLSSVEKYRNELFQMLLWLVEVPRSVSYSLPEA